MPNKLIKFLSKELQNLEDAGLYQEPRAMTSHEKGTFSINDEEYANFTANNFIGHGHKVEVRKAARTALEDYGVCLSTSRVLTGTQQLHVDTERAIADFLGKDECITFGSRYEAHVGFFDALFDERDCVFCDMQCNPTLADGIRLSSARVFPFSAGDMDDLEDRLKRSRSARFRAVVTDGVFGLDGRIARLTELCTLAEAYDALVVVDDSLGFGVLGTNGRGTADLCQENARVDIITSSMTFALGAGAGGFVAGKAEVIQWLRQKSRPYLVGSSLMPAVCGAAMASLDLLKADTTRVDRLLNNAKHFREKLRKAGFNVSVGQHPIVGIKVGDAVAVQHMVEALLKENIYAVGFSYPVVPNDDSLVRIQINSHHTLTLLDQVAGIITEVGLDIGVIDEQSRVRKKRRKRRPTRDPSGTVAALITDESYPDMEAAEDDASSPSPSREAPTVATPGKAVDATELSPADDTDEDARDPTDEAPAR